MSGCERFRDLLQEDLDGRLDPRARTELAAHVGSCAACAREAEGLRRVRAGLRAMGPVSAPPGFREEVLGRMPARGRLFRLPWFAVGAVAAAAVVVVAVTVARQDSPAPETARVAAPAEKSPGALLDAREAVGAAADAEEDTASRTKLGKSETAGTGPVEEKGESRDAGAKRPQGPAGEIPPDARPPADPAPPAAPPSAPPVAAGKAAGEESDRDAAPPAAEIPAPPRVRIVVFRSREAAARFVEGLGAAERRLDAPPAPGTRAKERQAPKAAAAAQSPEPGAGDDAYVEVARVGLKDPAALARARNAAAAAGGIVSDSLMLSLADDALVPESVARAVVESVAEEVAKSEEPATAPAGTGGDTDGGPTTGGGGAGAGATGFTAPGAKDAVRKEAPTPRTPGKTAPKPGAPPADGGRTADDAKGRADGASRAQAAGDAPEILVVVFLPADPPPTGTAPPPR